MMSESGSIEESSVEQVKCQRQTGTVLHVDLLSAQRRPPAATTDVRCGPSNLPYAAIAKPQMRRTGGVRDNTDFGTMSALLSRRSEWLEYSSDLQS